MRATPFLSAVILIFGLAGQALAQTTASQQVTIQISNIAELSVSGNPGQLAPATPAAGNDLSPATDAASTYSFSTNQTTRKITALLSSAMPAGTTLEIELAAPGSTWSSAGKKTLSTTSVDLATGNRGFSPAKVITYTFTTTLATGVVAPATRNVVLTLTAQ